jgi:hypothetical protein
MIIVAGMYKRTYSLLCRESGRAKAREVNDEEEKERGK